MSSKMRLPTVVAPATRRVMQANRGRDTSPELAIRSRLHALGLRYRVASPLPFNRRRRADVFFSRVGLYVFVDGCYWHGCPEHYVEPKTNTDFWRAKLSGNRSRDIETTARLRAMGYEVLRFWEHDDPGSVAATVEAEYRALLDRIAASGDRRLWPSPMVCDSRLVGTGLARPMSMSERE